jgi:hypothetical protein
MDDKKSLAADALVTLFKGDLNSKNLPAGQFPKFDVMISGDVDYASTGAGELEETRYDLPVQRREPRPDLQSLQIDNVAGEVNDVGGNLPQKCQEVAGSGRGRTQMNVGQPERSIRLSHPHPPQAFEQDIEELSAAS